MKHIHSRHTMLFRVVTTVVFSLLLLNTIAVSYSVQDDPISQILLTIENIFFATTYGTVSTSPSSTTTSTSDSTYRDTIDPSKDPPPPPPPQ